MRPPPMTARAAAPAPAERSLRPAPHVQGSVAAAALQGRMNPTGSADEAPAAQSLAVPAAAAAPGAVLGAKPAPDTVPAQPAPGPAAAAEPLTGQQLERWGDAVKLCAQVLVRQEKRSEDNVQGYVSPRVLQEISRALTPAGMSRLAGLCLEQWKGGTGALSLEEASEIESKIVAGLDKVAAADKYAKSALRVVFEAMIGWPAPFTRASTAAEQLRQPAGTLQNMHPDVEDLLGVRIVTGEERVEFFRGADPVALGPGVSTRLFGVKEVAEKKVQVGDVDPTLQELPGLPEAATRTSRKRSVVFVFSGASENPARVLAQGKASLPTKLASMIEVQETPKSVRVYVTPLNAALLAEALSSGFEAWKQKGFAVPHISKMEMFVWCKDRKTEEFASPFGYKSCARCLRTIGPSGTRMRPYWVPKAKEN